jgi:DNA-directed RNA polymerase specialized sigma subunit
MRRLDPAKRWVDDDDHDQHLKLALARALYHHHHDHGLPLHEYVEHAVEAADWHWSRMTRRERLRSKHTVSIHSLLTEPASPGFLDSVIAASEFAALLEKLTPIERIVVRAIVEVGRSHEEVGAQIGMPKKSVGRIKRRALAKIRGRK